MLKLASDRDDLGSLMTGFGMILAAIIFLVAAVVRYLAFRRVESHARSGWKMFISYNGDGPPPTGAVEGNRARRQAWFEAATRKKNHIAARMVKSAERAMMVSQYGFVALLVLSLFTRA